MFVKGVGDLQPTDEYSDNHIIIAVIHQGHLALEITDVMFEALLGLYLDREEVIVVLLRLHPGSILVIECLPHLFETSEYVPRERVKTVIGGDFETGCKHATQNEVIVRVYCHLVLVLPEVHGINCPRVALEARHHELFREAVRGDFLREW